MFNNKIRYKLAGLNFAHERILLLVDVLTN